MLYPGHVVMDDELAMLAGIHKTLCQERGIELDSVRGQRLAAHLFKMFLNGLTEQEAAGRGAEPWAASTGRPGFPAAAFDLVPEQVEGRLSYTFRVRWWLGLLEQFGRSLPE